jgi:hypothetical protein
VLGILATYNFIKDPLPESSITKDKPVEFDDPRKSQPVALSSRPRPRDALAEKKPRDAGPAAPPPKLSVGGVAPDAAGLFIGGKF